MRCGFCNLFTRANAAGRAGDARTCASCAARPARSRDALGAAPLRPAGDRRRHAHLPQRRRARPAVRHRPDELGAAAAAASRCRSRPRRPPRRPDRLAVLAAHGTTPGQHRRAELPRRRGARGRPAAAARRGGAGAGRDPRRRLPGAQPRPDLRHRRPDRRDLGSSPAGGAGLAAGGALPLPAVRAPADRPGPPRRRTAHRPTALGRPAAGAVPAGPGHAARGRLPAAVDAAVPPRRRSRRRPVRTTAARTTAWSGWAAAPAPTPAACTTRSTTRSASAQVRAIIDDYLARPADDFRLAEVGFAPRRRRAAPPLAGQVAAARRGRGPGRLRGPVRRPTSTRTSRNWPSLAERGWLVDDRRPAAPDPEGLARSDADRPVADLRRGPRGDGRDVRAGEPDRSSTGGRWPAATTTARTARSPSAGTPPEQLRADRAALARFVDWVTRQLRRAPAVGPVHAVGRGR